MQEAVEQSDGRRWEEDVTERDEAYDAALCSDFPIPLGILPEGSSGWCCEFLLGVAGTAGILP